MQCALAGVQHDVLCCVQAQGLAGIERGAGGVDVAARGRQVDVATAVDGAALGGAVVAIAGIAAAGEADAINLNRPN